MTAEIKHKNIVLPLERLRQLLQNQALFAIIITVRNNDNGRAAILKMLE